jgi:hypothetical protein
MGDLPMIHRGPRPYTVGLYMIRDGRRWLVRLRLPDGGFVTIASYRIRFFANRLVHRSWKLAR